MKKYLDSFFFTNIVACVSLYPKNIDTLLKQNNKVYIHMNKLSQ